MVVRAGESRRLDLAVLVALLKDDAVLESTPTGVSFVKDGVELQLLSFGEWRGGGSVAEEGEVEDGGLDGEKAR